MGLPPGLMPTALEMRLTARRSRCRHRPTVAARCPVAQQGPGKRRDEMRDDAKLRVNARSPRPGQGPGDRDPLRAIGLEVGRWDGVDPSSVPRERGPGPEPIAGQLDDVAAV